MGAVQLNHFLSGGVFSSCFIRTSYSKNPQLRTYIFGKQPKQVLIKMAINTILGYLDS